MDSRSTNPRRSRATVRLLAVVAGVMLAATFGFYVDAATTTKPYTATWVGGSGEVANPPNQLAVAQGSNTLTLRIFNDASQQTLGSANITPPSGYTLQAGSSVSQGDAPTLSGNTLQLRNLNLATSSSLDVTIKVSATCTNSSAFVAWTLRVKQANNFSGPPGNDFSLKAPTSAPKTKVECWTLRFASGNQPNTTQTSNIIKAGPDSTGDYVKVEIVDSGGNVVDTNAQVTLARYFFPSGGTLTGGGPVAASHGVASFPSLSINRAGAYKLQASSPVASNMPISDLFMVADTVETCSGADCTFNETQGQNSYGLDPTTGTIGATYAAALNMTGLTISCQATYGYPDSRQPNSVWFNYSGGSAKTVTIVIDKRIVQATAENGASFYRVCFTSPDRFRDRLGNLAPRDPAVTAFFGGTTSWYTGLLPDCSDVNNVAPCVISWTGTQGGDRLGTFIAPPGDPGYH